MELIKNIILDIDNPVYTSIEAKQNDALSRFIQFTLVNKGLPLDLTSHTVKIFGVKQDNTLIFNQVEIIDSLAGIIKVELTTQALSVPGTLNCELVIYGLDNSVLSSKLFNIMVTKSLRDDSAIESTNEFSALTQGISKLNAWDNQFEQKYNGLEAQYATDLTQVKSSLAESTLKFSSDPLKNVRIKLKNKQPVTIVCHGDSMTWGYTTGAVQAVNNYPMVLQSILRYIFGYNEIYVINEGHSGLTSAYGLANFTSQVIAHNPDLLISIWGLNDSALEQVPLPNYISNMREIIVLAKENNIEHIVSSPVPIVTNNISTMYRLENKNYVEALKFLAIEQGIFYCDLYEEILRLFSNNAMSVSGDYDSTGHLSDYSIVAHYIASSSVCDIYSPTHKDGDTIRFETNQTLNTVSASSINTGAIFGNRYYVVDSTKPNELIRMLVYVNSKVRLDIITWVALSGGNINITNFGNIIATFNSYGITNVNKVFSIELTKGLYCIELKGSNVETGKSFTVSSAVYNDIKTKSLSYNNLILQNSWVINGSGFSEAIYMKDNNIVRLSGLIKNGVTTTDTIIANLPLGYRPSKDVVVPVISFESSVAYPGYLRVKSNGDIVCYVNIHNGFLPLEFSFPLI